MKLFQNKNTTGRKIGPKIFDRKISNHEDLIVKPRLYEDKISITSLIEFLE